jgi:hypothetical protein
VVVENGDLVLADMKSLLSDAGKAADALWARARG